MIYDVSSESHLVDRLRMLQDFSWVRWGWQWVHSHAEGPPEIPGLLVCGYVKPSPPNPWTPFPRRFFFLDVRNPKGEGIGKPDASVNILAPSSLVMKSLTTQRPTVLKTGNELTSKEVFQRLDQWRGHWINHARHYGYHFDAEYRGPTTFVPQFGLNLETQH